MESLISDGRGCYKCSPADECKVPLEASQAVECSVHGKLRKKQSMMSDGYGGFKCSAGDNCKMPGEASKPAWAIEKGIVKGSKGSGKDAWDQLLSNGKGSSKDAREQAWCSSKGVGDNT